MGIGSDECFSAYSAQLPPITIIKWLSTGDNPPFWELLLHYWIKVFGISELSIRFPALIFNVLTIIPIYFIGEKYIKKHVGTIASLLFIFSSLSLFLAHEARVYSLLGLLCSSSVYFFLSAIKNPQKIKLLLYLTFINGVILYSHYIAYWVIIVQVLLFLSFKTIRLSLKWFYLLHLGVLTALIIPLTPILINRFFTSGVNGTWIVPTTGVTDLYNMLWKFSNQPLTTVIFTSIVILALLKIIITKKENIQPVPYGIFINSFIWIPLIASFILSFKIGFFLDRYFYFVSPFYYLSISISLNYLLQKFSAMNIISNLTIVLLMLFTFNISTKESRISGYHQNTELVKEEIDKYSNESTTVIILCPSWYDKEIVYYLDRNLFTTYFEKYDQSSIFKEPLNERQIFPVNHYSELSIDKKITKIIFIDKDAEFNAKGNGIIDHLNQTYQYQKQYKVENVMFTEFTSN